MREMINDATIVFSAWMLRPHCFVPRIVADPKISEKLSGDSQAPGRSGFTEKVSDAWA